MKLYMLRFCAYQKIFNIKHYWILFTPTGRRSWTKWSELFK